MKITYVPPSPHAGKTVHLQPLRAQGLIDAGFAVAVPMPARGTREWHQEMQELEAERVKNILTDQRQNVSTVPTWSVRFLEQSRKFVVVVNSLAGEVIYGENVQLDSKNRPDYKGAEKQLITTLKQCGCPQVAIQKYLDSKSGSRLSRAGASTHR